MANEGASCISVLKHRQTFCPFTYYFESFSNMVFVSSSVRGLILNCLWESRHVIVTGGEKTWVCFPEVALLFTGSDVTQTSSSVPGLFLHSFSVQSTVSLATKSAAIGWVIPWKNAIIVKKRGCFTSFGHPDGHHLEFRFLLFFCFLIRGTDLRGSKPGSLSLAS